MKKIILLLQILSMSLLLSGCKQPESVLQIDIVNNRPYWRNITIGASKESSCNQIKGMKDINLSSIRWDLSSYENIDDGVSWQFINKRENSGYISFKNERVALIGLSYIDKFTLEDVVTILGEPQYISVLSTIGPGKSYTILHYFYPNMGICLSQDTTISKDSSTYMIRNKENIKYITFSDPMTNSFQIDSGCQRGQDKAEVEGKYQPWKGYGKYEVFQQR